MVHMPISSGYETWRYTIWVCWFKLFHVTLPRLKIQTHSVSINPTRKCIIFDHTGAYITTTTLDRIRWLWERYHEMKPTCSLPRYLQPTTIALCNQTSSVSKSLCLHLQGEKPKSILPKNTHQFMHPTITSLLIHFNIIHLYILSPFTCPTTLKQHHSTTHPPLPKRSQNWLKWKIQIFTMAWLQIYKPHWPPNRD